MKTLQTNEYNLNGIKFPRIFSGCDFRTLEEFYDINGLDENDANEEYVKFLTSRYYLENWQWSGIRERSMQSHILHIDETLCSHPAHSFVTKIKDTFANDVKTVYANDEDPKKKGIITVVFKPETKMVNHTCIGKHILLNCKETSEFYRLLDFYLYYITFINYENGEITVYLEPAYTECVTDKLRKNGKYVYHITDLKNTESISKKGIRPRTAKIKDDGTLGGYRYFPERVFYIGAGKTKEETVDNIKTAAKMLNKKNYAIISVDIKKHYIDFWKDEAAPELENAVYSYTALPKSLICGIATNPNDILFDL